MYEVGEGSSNHWDHLFRIVCQAKGAKIICSLVGSWQILCLVYNLAQNKNDVLKKVKPPCCLSGGK